MTTEKDERPGNASGPFEKKSAITTDHRHTTRPVRRLGCLLGCEGYGHDPGCPVGKPFIPRSRCGRPCQSWSFARLALEDVCPCDEAQEAVGELVS